MERPKTHRIRPAMDFYEIYADKRKAAHPHRLLNTQEDEVRLYRIMDVTLRRSLWERMFGLGTIHCCSADKSTPEFDIAWVKDAAQVKETLSDMVEAERMAKRVSSREFMTDDEDGEML